MQCMQPTACAGHMSICDQVQLCGIFAEPQELQAARQRSVQGIQCSAVQGLLSWRPGTTALAVCCADIDPAKPQQRHHRLAAAGLE
jgi:hypothetical protein